MIIYKSKWILSFGEKVLKDSCLVVQDGKILDVINENQLYKYQNSEIIDYGSSVITPGFINLHTHLQFTDLTNNVILRACPKNLPGVNVINSEQILRSAQDDELSFVDWIVNLIKQYSQLTPEEKTASFKKGLKESLISGTTCVCQLSKEEEFFEILNNSPIKSVLFLETFSNSEELSIKEFETLKKKIRDYTEKASEDLKIGISPHSIYNVHPVLWKKISEYAAKNNIIVQTHLAESKAEMDWLKYGHSDIDKLHSFVGWNKITPNKTGINPVQYLEELGVLSELKKNLILTHLNQLPDDEIIDLVQKYGINIAFCPKSNIILHDKTLNIQNLSKIREKIGLGTDSKSSNFDLNLLHEANFVKNLKNSTGLDTLKILDMLTINSARILKIDNITGSLERGKDADFLVFNLDKFETYNDFIDKDSPDNVFIKGKQVVKNKVITDGMI